MVNADKKSSWADDVARSVEMYNQWYLGFAPGAYQKARQETELSVREALEASSFGRSFTAKMLATRPDLLSVLRMMTAPPLARDRLTGLSGAPKSLIDAMENDHTLPNRTSRSVLEEQLARVCRIISMMADFELLPWLAECRHPTEDELTGALRVLGDRVCRATADPVIRNAQETRQLDVIRKFLEDRGYSMLQNNQRNSTAFDLGEKSFAFRLNVPITDEGGGAVNLPVDAVVMPPNAKGIPLLIEAKSAGDFTNVNKRRKEEAVKIAQLKATYGNKARFILFLCGYFDENYLRYEASAGIDWVWEHRPDDLSQFGV